MPPDQAEDGAIQAPHRIARCAGQPEVLWCQHQCGIWRSSNAGGLWQRISTAPRSASGFAVAVHPADADTAWVVPAVADQCCVLAGGALVVNRTTNGGASLETLRHGLPQQQCCDLVYRHGLDVADDGRSLPMASTTGGRWASADGGVPWQTVSLTLTPVYAVRFG